MAGNTRDMTAGKPAGLLLSFAVPLMLGNVFQQLYIIVDTMIVGQFVGVQALASLGAVEWLLFFVQGIVSGVTQGFSILTAQRFGAEDGAGVRRAAAHSILLTAAITVAATVLSLLFSRSVLRFLHTPDNIMEDAMTYLTVLFGGMACYAGYNVLASILRALGNSRAPLAAMIVAALTNIVLDLLFVVGFHWGVGGAALATVIAQLASCLICLLVVRRIPLLALERQDWRFDGALAARLLKLGVPIAFQNLIIAAGGMTVQFVVNGFGFLFVAGFTATNKLYGLLEVAATSFGFSMATYAGQNLGAGQYDRIRLGMRSARRMSIATALVITAAMLLFGRPILGLFISGEPEIVRAVSDIAYLYLAVMSAALFVLYLLHVYRSALQGMGDALTPMLSGVVEMIMRTAVALLLPLLIGETGIYFAEIAAWAGAAALLMAAYYRRAARLPAGNAGRDAGA